MKSRILMLVGAVAVTALIALSGGVLANTGSGGGPALGIEVSISQAAGREGVYACTARISDAATGEVLSEPSVLFRSGEEAQTRSSGVKIQGKASDLIVTVSADAAKRAATVRVELAAGASRSALQVVNVQL